MSAKNRLRSGVRASVWGEAARSRSLALAARSGPWRGLDPDTRRCAAAGSRHRRRAWEAGEGTVHVDPRLGRWARRRRTCAKHRASRQASTVDLSIEIGAGQGAVQGRDRILGARTFSCRPCPRPQSPRRSGPSLAMREQHFDASWDGELAIGVGLRLTSTVKSKPPTRPSSRQSLTTVSVGVALPIGKLYRATSFYVQHQFEETHWAKGKPGTCIRQPSQLTLCSSRHSQVVHREHRRASCASFVKQPFSR